MIRLRRLEPSRWGQSGSHRTRRRGPWIVRGRCSDPSGFTGPHGLPDRGSTLRYHFHDGHCWPRAGVEWSTGSGTAGREGGGNPSLAWHPAGRVAGCSPLRLVGWRIRVSGAKRRSYGCAAPVPNRGRNSSRDVPRRDLSACPSSRCFHLMIRLRLNRRAFHIGFVSPPRTSRPEHFNPEPIDDTEPKPLVPSFSDVSRDLPPHRLE